MNVAHTETQKQTVAVWKLVPMTKTRTVCEDLGKWIEKRVETACQTAAPACRTACATRCNTSCNNGCAPSAPAPQTIAVIQKVWVPNIVKKEVEFACNEWQQIDEEREIQVTTCKPVEKTRTVKVCEWVTEKQEYEYQVTVMKQEKKSVTEKVW